MSSTQLDKQPYVDGQPLLLSQVGLPRRPHTPVADLSSLSPLTASSVTPALCKWSADRALTVN